MSKVLIVGGGAAGMLASIFAARNGNEVHVFEKNEKLGKKLFITGKGRCNLTNACDMDTLFSSVVTNDKFLYSSFYGYTNQDVMDFFESLGLQIKVERGNRVFPASDHSSDVIKVLEKEMKAQGVQIHLYQTVTQIAKKDGRFAALKLADGTVVEGDACILCTGGMSYQTTGSTGDGYRFAKAIGHKVTELRPSLVPIETKEYFVPELMGLSLKNVETRILDGKKVLYQDFGEMLFTHYGVSGPLILSASAYIGKELSEKKELKLSIDLKPSLSEEQLDARVLREFEANHNKQFKNAIGGLFPSKLVPVMIAESGIDSEKKVNVISKEERQGFVHLIKNFEMTLIRLRDYKEAIITQGGINVKEVNPSTMESKLVEGVYFAGELLDLDAVTGGFNLQIAWSTAYAAGSNIW